MKCSTERKGNIVFQLLLAGPLFDKGVDERAEPRIQGSPS